MTKGEAVNWLINIMADIGKIEHQELWHYEQALMEIRDIMQDELNDAMPTFESDPADLVRVCRCDDCLFYAGKQYGDYGRCDRNHTWMKTDSYCSEGVRKDDKAI